LEVLKYATYKNKYLIIKCRLPESVARGPRSPGHPPFYATARKFIIIHYKRRNQNKSDSTVNKNRDLLDLLVESWLIDKERFM